MGRTSRAGSWGLVLALASPAPAGDDGPPPLTLPGEVAPAGDLPAPKPAPSSPKDPLRPSTNLLRPRTAPPGPTRAPKPASTRAPKPAPASPSPPLLEPAGASDAASFSDGPPLLDGPSEGPPPLDGPSEIRPLPNRRSSGPMPGGSISTRRLGRSAPPLEEPIPDAPPSLLSEPAPSGLLEPVPSGELEPLPDGPEPGRDLDRIEPRERPDPPPPARRRLGIFPPSAFRARPGTGPNSSIRVEPRSDPAADASLKRRIEAKVNEAVGDRGRDVEVRVVDRDVVVRVRVDRFWNRRGVRRTIENLPALAGYKAKVEIDD